MTSQRCQDKFTDSFGWDGQNCEAILHGLEDKCPQGEQI